MSAQPPPVMKDEEALRQRLRSALGDLNIRWPQALSPLEEDRATQALEALRQALQSDISTAELLEMVRGPR